MVTQLADAKRVDPRVDDAVVSQPRNPPGGHLSADHGQLSAARGIAIAAAISLPLWALLAFTLYMLL